MKVEMLSKLIRKAMAPLSRKVNLMIGRGILTAINDSKSLQLANLTLMADEVKSDAEVFNHFGFTSNAPKNSEVIMLSVGGNREHGVIIGSENRNLRLKNVAEGDSAMYNKNGKYIWLKGDDAEILLSKLKVSNDSHELISVLVDWMQAMIDSKNVTAIGPQPLTPETITALNVIKAKLETFKKD